MKYFKGFDFTDFWDDSDYAKKEYILEPPTDEMIKKIEKELKYKLPESYIELMKAHNGGIPSKSCYPTNVRTSWAEDHIAIYGILGINCIVADTEFAVEEWEYPDIGVAICDCPSAGHDMIFLDYRKCGPTGEPCVVHVDQEWDYKITWLAKDFETFIKGLVSEDRFEED